MTDEIITNKSIRFLSNKYIELNGFIANDDGVRNTYKLINDFLIEHKITDIKVELIDWPESEIIDDIDSKIVKDYESPYIKVLQMGKMGIKYGRKRILPNDSLYDVQSMKTISDLIFRIAIYSRQKKFILPFLTVLFKNCIRTEIDEIRKIAYYSGFYIDVDGVFRPKKGTNIDDNNTKTSNSTPITHSTGVKVEEKVEEKGVNISVTVSGNNVSTVNNKPIINNHEIKKNEKEQNLFFKILKKIKLLHWSIFILGKKLFSHFFL